jgi:hypothetical protein
MRIVTIVGGLLLVLSNACHRESELAYYVNANCHDLAHSLKRESEEYRTYLDRSALNLSEPQRQTLDTLFESSGFGSRSQGGRTSTWFALSARFQLCIRARHVAEEKLVGLRDRFDSIAGPFWESNDRAVQAHIVEALADLAAEIDTLPLQD